MRASLRSLAYKKVKELLEKYHNQRFKIIKPFEQFEQGQYIQSELMIYNFYAKKFESYNIYFYTLIFSTLLISLFFHLYFFNSFNFNNYLLITVLFTSVSIFIYHRIVKNISLQFSYSKIEELRTKGILIYN